MATIQQFEDLICWQKARLLTKEVYISLRQCSDRGFKDQIQRASVSVMSNIAEGFERGTNQEFLNYLYIAKGSAGEVRAQLYAAYDIGYLNIETFKYLNNLADNCSRLISSFIKSLSITKLFFLSFQRKLESMFLQHKRGSGSRIMCEMTRRGGSFVIQSKSVKASEIKGLQYKREMRKKDTWLEDFAASQGLMFASDGRVVSKDAGNSR